MRSHGLPCKRYCGIDPIRAKTGGYIGLPRSRAPESCRSLPGILAPGRSQAKCVSREFKRPGPRHEPATVRPLAKVTYRERVPALVDSERWYAWKPMEMMRRRVIVLTFYGIALVG